ncbi:hypothetical protein ACIPMU_39120 [Streptomyces cyaneofuscatus]|uniref:hypothetical protein n=1 Tax=Streptomyces cyaneofuscatus TaxID=66883 RepID=UPI00381A6A0C
MKRRLATTLGALAATVMLGAAAPSAAQAANGQLIFDGNTIQNPTGCIDVPPGTMIHNFTDAHLQVFSERGCTGDVVGFVPQSAHRFNVGQSVLVLD